MTMTYNWIKYDCLLATGRLASLTALEDEAINLEVISTIDNFKDYDLIDIKLRPGSITNIAPNPTSSICDVDYTINKGNSAYLILTNGIIYNILPLDVTT